MRHRYRYLLLLSLLNVLLACGGGSDSATVVEPTPQAPSPPTSTPVNQAPVITLNGAVQMQLMQGEVFLDPGASASDAEDGDLSASIVTVGSVDAATPGTYTLTYSVSDSAGLRVESTRTVTVNALIAGPQDVHAVLQVLSRRNGVSPETVYFSAQASTCDDCVDNFGLDTALADAWSELSYHFVFDDDNSGSFERTTNTRNSQSSGAPRAFHTFECTGSADPNWNAQTLRCEFNVGVRVQAKDGDYNDAFVQINIQPLYGEGGYYTLQDIWCVASDGDFSTCPHNAATRHLTDSPVAGSFDQRLFLYSAGNGSAYGTICVGANERNVTVAAIGPARPLIAGLQHSTRPGSCLTNYTNASIATVASNHAPARNSEGDLLDGYAFNATYTGLRLGAINNGPTYHLANFHDLDMDWSTDASYNGEIVVLTTAWNCKNSGALDCSNIPYAMFGSYTSIVSKSNAANLAPVNIACYDGCGATNFVFADIDVDRAYEHNARFMGLWGTIFSNNWFRGNNVGGNGGKERLSVRPGEAIGGIGGTAHDLDKNPELLDGTNNYRGDVPADDYYNRYNIAVDNIFNQPSHDVNHDSAAMLHLGGNYTGEYGNRYIADDTGDLVFQTQFTGRYKIVRQTDWAAGYPYCNLRIGFYADDTLYNDASTVLVEAPASCSGSYDWPAATPGLSYADAPGG